MGMLRVQNKPLHRNEKAKLSPWQNSCVTRVIVFFRKNRKYMSNFGIFTL